MRSHAAVEVWTADDRRVRLAWLACTMLTGALASKNLMSTVVVAPFRYGTGAG